MHQKPLWEITTLARPSNWIGEGLQGRWRDKTRGNGVEAGGQRRGRDGNEGKGKMGGRGKAMGKGGKEKLAVYARYLKS